MKTPSALLFVSLFIISLAINSCSKRELGNEEAAKLISQYYQLPFQTRIAIDINYDGYGWPPEKYQQLANQGFINIIPKNSNFLMKRFHASATEKIRQYWIQDATMETNEGRVWLFVFKGYKIDIKDVNVSSIAKDNKAEAEVVMTISDISPIQNIFSPPKQTEIKGTINFKLYENGWKIVEDNNSKALFQPIEVPLHWAGYGEIIYNNSSLEDQPNLGGEG